MRAALFALLAAAVVLAWIVARRRPEHRPIALAFSIALGADIGRAILIHYFPPNLDPSAPLRTGARLIAAYLDRALYIAWPCAIAAAVVRVLARRRAWPIAILYVIAVAVLILGYPALRFGALRRAYLAIELAALLVGVATIGAWWRRSGTDDSGAVTTRTARILVLGQCAVVLTTYGPSLFGEAWNVARAAYLIELAAVILLQLIEVFHDDA